MLGAGGAARAVAVETALAGAASVLSSTATSAAAPSWPGPARPPAPGVAATFVRWTSTYAVPEDADVLVNATSVGFGDADAPATSTWTACGPGLVVADVVVSPPRTALLRAAAVRGATTLDGLGHAGGPGRALAVRHWTGVEPDREVMRAAAARALGL